MNLIVEAAEFSTLIGIAGGSGGGCSLAHFARAFAFSRTHSSPASADAETACADAFFAILDTLVC